MNSTTLRLPDRASKPRASGVTMMIDGGLSTGLFRDVVASAAEYIDFVKFGWGTALVTNDIREKIDFLGGAGVDFYFGGTLFEKYVLQGQLDEFCRLCHSYGCRYVEVSNGTIDLANEDKADLVRALSGEFAVISEVGFKDLGRSETLASKRWVQCIREDLDAGAKLVTLEARESGRAGICHGDGTLRLELLDEVVASDLPVERLLFEAPTTELQNLLVRALGSDVNLGNVGATAVLGLETVRLGLRSDTLSCFEPVPA